jgi:dihydroxy-acid dehydratase
MSKDNISEHLAPVYVVIEYAPARSMMRATGF